MTSPLATSPSLDPTTALAIRRELEIAHCKWDAQVGDVDALAPFALLLGERTWHTLSAWAERLSRETHALEAALLARPTLHRVLGLPRSLRDVLARADDVTPTAARIERFDFHFTTDGWRISEVNSDVPGGFIEAFELARLMTKHVPKTRIAGDPAGALVDAIARRVGDDATVALVSAPGYVEDHQIVAYLARRLQARGIRAHTVTIGQLRFSSGGARVRLLDEERTVQAVYRFYQAEWLAELGATGDWRPLFARGTTPVANAPGAALTESKRAPLAWEAAGCDMSAFRALLPETRDPRDAPWATDDGWVLKRAYSNTGDSITIRAALPRRAWLQRAASVLVRPRDWVAQRRFAVAPVAHETGAVFPCVGVYTVDGVAAGAYARLASGHFVDTHARDVALLITEEA